ncbi:MAG: YlmH/Sll1252 family protein [Erysipelotrichaceae bacterium]|nr:YlmH/Sll1252 family protein [Erysipelotrichaceae bacterium]MDD4642574.1 YlmH/Sll1252 family protein [Erysipelotrichaceae bacterium]
MRISKNNHQEELLRRIDDLLYQSERDGLAKFTNFLTVSDYQLIDEYLRHRCDYMIDGGYPDALFKRVIINHQGESNIFCLTCTINNKYLKINHRDVLGSVMNLGIKRDQFGDIWIDDNIIVIYVVEHVYRYIIDNLTRINQLRVKFSISEESFLPRVNIKESVKVVSSLRLDTIVASMINVSRSKTQSLIKQGSISVNFKVLEENSYLCNNGDTISIRGYGRYIVNEVVKSTKNKRLLLKLGKYE